jgi:hypothetical protein
VQFEFAFDIRHRWQLEIRRVVHDGSVVMTNREMSSFDGTNLFSVIYQPVQLTRQPDGSTVSIGSNSTSQDGQKFGSVMPASLLPGVGPESDFLWFALLAGEVLVGDEARRFPTIVGNQGEEPGGHVYDLTFQRKAATRWLEEAVWQFNKHYVNREPWLVRHEVLAPENPQQAAACDALVSELNSGARQFSTVFRVEEFSASDGIEFPKRFRLDHTPGNVRVAHGTAHFFREATVASYQPTRLGPSERPPLAGSVWVEDRRFRVREADRVRNWIRYPIEDQQWILDTNDSRLQAIASKKPPYATPKGMPTQQWRWLARGLLLAALIVPAALIWRHRKLARI